MKYINLFENYYKFKKGDFVYVKTTSYYSFYFKNNPGEIVEIGPSSLELYFYNLPKNILLSDDKKLWFSKKAVTRKLDDDEVLKYKISIDTNKYNL